MENKQEVEYFQTIEEIAEEFQKLLAIALDYDENLSEGGNPYIKTIERFQKVQQSIIQHSIFSPNESLKEIDTNHLRYFLLPYYVGDIFGRVQENRKKNLEYSKIYLTEFLKLTQHYELLEKHVKKYWKTMTENPKYQMTREERLQSYKEQKDLEIKLKNIEKVKEESDQRETYVLQMKICIFKALDQLKQLEQEFEILEYKEKIEKDKEAKQQHDHEMSKPIPKIKVWNIPKQEDQNMPYLVSNLLNHNHAQDEHGHLCHTCIGKTAEEHKFEKRQQVWQPPKGMLPTMTLDQLADIEIAKMEEQEKKSKIAAEKKKKEDDEDSDCDESVNDRRVKEQRAWDDWKDENEKGAGNRMGK